MLPRFIHLLGIALDSKRDLSVSDQSNHLIRKVTLTTPIFGATSPTFALNNVTAANAGEYLVAVSNGNGTASSSYAEVNIRAGNLDPSFGTNGKFTAAISGGDDSAQSVVVQPDGRFIVFGISGQNLVVGRYNTNGTVDSSFNSFTAIDTAGSGSAAKVLLQPDGKIILVGTRFNTESDFYVVRLNANGSLDTDFNTTNTPGKASFNINGNDIAGSAALQADGKLLIGGNSGASNEPFTLIRVNTNGTLDTTFGINGVATYAYGDQHRVGKCWCSLMGRSWSQAQCMWRSGLSRQSVLTQMEPWIPTSEWVVLLSRIRVEVFRRMTLSSNWMGRLCWLVTQEMGRSVME